MHRDTRGKRDYSQMEPTRELHRRVMNCALSCPWKFIKFSRSGTSANCFGHLIPFSSLSLLPTLYIYIYIRSTRSRAHIYPFIRLYRALEGEKIFESGNKLQLEPVLFMRSLWGRENVNTCRAIHFRSGRIYFDSTLMAVLVVEIRSFVSRIY